ncbi:hypothetical protein LTR62_004588 [Meristemomyces frigidus]|uniref:Uncharacterized protein n=1 Tax=Meristemomyces frigidus TaxID=1508187 RepID=A0AAN7TFB1_9PEZI|nr:hypothetical protein LTR62_004588 [Meristemomyces frigidus]
MSPMFASADIAALVAAYSPPTPLKDRPSFLFRKRPRDDNLVDSRHVLDQFHSLLETSSSRIALPDLASRLKIDKVDWLLECYHDPLYYGGDGLHILPLPEIRRVLEDGYEGSLDSTVEVNGFATRNDLARSTLRSLIECSLSEGKLHWWNDRTKGSSHFYSDALRKAVNDYLQSLASSEYAQTEYAGGVDLCSRFPNVPAALLLEMAQSISTQEQYRQPAGEWQLLQDRAVFIPASHIQNVEKRKRVAQQTQLDQSARHLVVQGYCKVENDQPAGLMSSHDEHVDSMSYEIRRRAESQLEAAASRQFHELSHNNAEGVRQLWLIQRDSLEDTLRSLKIIAPQETSRIWHARDGSEAQAKLTTSTLESLEHEIGRDILNIVIQCQPYRSHIENTITTTLEELAAQETTTYQTTLLERWVLPLHLYTTGLSSITDPTLVQNLSEFIIDYFRRDVLPTTTKSLTERRLLLDHQRRKDYDKLSDTISASKTISDLATATTKSTKKEKIRRPTPTQTRNAKRTILEQKSCQLLSAKISRGSDILQNLIWILMAEKLEGTFMSSGKDTSRMIKMYASAVGGEEGHVQDDVKQNIERLEQFKAQLKAGEAGGDVIRDMKSMAVGAVERWVGGHCSVNGTEVMT